MSRVDEPALTKQRVRNLNTIIIIMIIIMIIIFCFSTQRPSLRYLTPVLYSQIVQLVTEKFRVYRLIDSGNWELA